MFANTQSVVKSWASNTSHTLTKVVRTDRTNKEKSAKSSSKIDINDDEWVDLSPSESLFLSEDTSVIYTYEAVSDQTDNHLIHIDEPGKHEAEDWKIVNLLGAEKKTDVENYTTVKVEDGKWREVDLGGGVEDLRQIILSKVAPKGGSTARSMIKKSDGMVEASLEDAVYDLRELVVLDDVVLSDR